ncbi:uncharacterized protein LOC121250017 [Juglans microcarpa x Juglans regia]|uniref:uncharacterized protein LOC121250017 n=1 Tax=Juglans microcarpa x Juglans regia TaxID=2249226 RepID=UPI001B7EDA73|nr:uncharacterized protein LOC121250017 [Juglans microcarpa x Juglans regia]
MSISLQNLFTNSPSRFTLYFATSTTYPPRSYSLPSPIDSRYLSIPLHSQNLARFSQRSYNLISFMTHHTTRLRVYGSQGTVQRNDVFGGLTFDSFLSIAELLCLVSSAAIFSIGFAANLAFLSSSKKVVLVDVGNRVSVWGVVLLAGGVAIGSWIRRQQWRRVSRERVTGGNEVNLLERVEKLEEDLRSSATIIRVLSRHLEKLGIRFRVTRKALKDPIAETAALAQKNSEATRALAIQEDILEKELGEIHKVLLAMQEQQQKQLELILAIGKTGKLLESKREQKREQDTTEIRNTVEEGLKHKETQQI